MKDLQHLECVVKFLSLHSITYLHDLDSIGELPGLEEWQRLDASLRLVSRPTSHPCTIELSLLKLNKTGVNEADCDLLE